MEDARRQSGGTGARGGRERGQQRGRGRKRRSPLRWSTGGGTARISSGGDAASFFLTYAHRCSYPHCPSWNPVEGGGVSSLSCCSPLRQELTRPLYLRDLSSFHFRAPPPPEDQAARPASSPVSQLARWCGQLVQVLNLACLLGRRGRSRPPAGSRGKRVQRPCSIVGAAARKWMFFIDAREPRWALRVRVGGYAWVGEKKSVLAETLSKLRFFGTS
jgi:hypothetical protein